MELGTPTSTHPDNLGDMLTGVSRRTARAWNHGNWRYVTERTAATAAGFMAGLEVPAIAEGMTDPMALAGVMGAAGLYAMIRAGPLAHDGERRASRVAGPALLLGAYAASSATQLIPWEAVHQAAEIAAAYAHLIF